MASKIQSVANLALGPRVIHVVGADGKTTEQVTLRPNEYRDLVLANPEGVIEKSWMNAGELWVGKQGEAPPDAHHPGALSAEVVAAREDAQAARHENAALNLLVEQGEAKARELQAKLDAAETAANDAQIEAAERGEAAKRMGEDLSRAQGEVARLEAELAAAKAPPAAPTKPSK